MKHLLKLIKRNSQGIISKNPRVPPLKKHRASEGMTAAIILIAFIITSAGVAFVILTLGSEMQTELGNIGKNGEESASSALQIEGGIISGYGSNDAINATVFNLGLVLDVGKVDLSSNAITIFLSVNHGESIELTSGGDTTDLVSASALSNSGKYGFHWVRGSGEIISDNEMVRCYIGFAATPASSSQSIIITIHSQVALMEIELLVPVQIYTGTNVL